MKLPIKICLPMFLLTGAWTAGAEQLHEPLIPAGTAWSQPSYARVEAGFSDTEFHARWDISRCDCGDMNILAEETLPGEVRTGELLLVNQDALLVRGFESHQGEITALLDSPVLMLQLLFVLMQHIEPAGPSVVTDVLSPEVTEPSEPIILDSGIAYGGFPAPWALSGSVIPGSGPQYRYQLRFEFALPEGGNSRIDLSGMLDYSWREFPVDDSLVLDGWSAAWLHLQTENKSGLTPGMTLGEFKKLH